MWWNRKEILDAPAAKNFARSMRPWIVALK